MLMRHLVVLVAVVLGLAGCQTTGASGVSNSTVSFLMSEGFKQQPYANLPVSVGSLRSVAGFFCENPRCKDGISVNFAEDPNATASFVEISKLKKLNYADQKKYMRGLLQDTGSKFGMTDISWSLFKNSNGSVGYTVIATFRRSAARQSLNGDPVYMAMTSVQSKVSSRLVLSVGTNRSLVARYASRKLVE
ncbi:MAG: hypothetical protein ACRCWF_17480 [Beijerinckiaceae bacterium]